MKKYSIPKEQRPKCIVPGCERKGQHTGTYLPNGFPRFRSKCDYHHKQRYTIGEWKWKQHRKDFCENVDGRLGFTCNYPIQDICQLQTDHIDGNAKNNSALNLQTLCANCHAYKTFVNGEHSNHNKTHNKSLEEQRKELSTLEGFLV